MKYIIAICIAEILISFIFPGYTQQLEKNFIRCSDTSAEVENSETEENVDTLTREKLYLKILDNNMFYLKISHSVLLLVIISTILLIQNMYKNIKMNEFSKYKKIVRFTEKESTKSEVTLIY